MERCIGDPSQSEAELRAAAKDWVAKTQLLPGLIQEANPAKGILGEPFLRVDCVAQQETFQISMIYQLDFMPASIGLIKHEVPSACRCKIAAHDFLHGPSANPNILLLLYERTANVCAQIYARRDVAKQCGILLPQPSCT